MASGYAPRWRRLLFKVAPWLFWVCPSGNHHWRWDNQVCYCREGENGAGWSGGVWVRGVEMHRTKDGSFDASHSASLLSRLPSSPHPTDNTE